MKHVLLIIGVLMSTSVFAGKIQKQGIKTASDCTAAGAALSNCLPEDSQIWMTSVTPPQQLSTAVTAGLIGGGGGNSGKNYLVNASFEGGNSGWTIAGATNAVNTSDFHDGAQSLTLTPTGAGSILQSVTPATNLKGSNLESGLWVKTTKTDVENCSYINAVEIECQKVTASGEWVYVPANAAGPAQGTSIGVKLKWGSTGGSIIVDMGYVGGATNLTTIAQAKHVGTLKYAGTASCYWSLNNASFASYSADTDCATPTVTGDLTAPSTKIPAFKMNVTAGSKYRITSKGIIFAATGTGSAQWRFSDGTTSTELSGAQNSASGTFGGLSGVITSIYEPTTSGLKTIEIQAKYSAGNADIDATVGNDLIIEVEQFPSQSQLAVNSLQSDTEWTEYTPTFAQFGTATATKFFWKKNGSDILIYGNFTTGSIGSGSPYITLPNGLLIDTAFYQSSVVSVLGKYVRGVAATGGGTYHGNVVFNGTDADKLYFSTGNGGDASTTVIANASAQFASTETQLLSGIRIKIAGWHESQRAPTLVGSVTSGAQNALRIEYASVSSTGTVSNESSDWINGNASLSDSSLYDLTLTSGIFSSSPVCYGNGTDTSGFSSYLTASSSSSTSVTVRMGNHLQGTAQRKDAEDFNIVCMGSR